MNTEEPFLPDRNPPRQGPFQPTGNESMKERNHFKAAFDLTVIFFDSAKSFVKFLKSASQKNLADVDKRLSYAISQRSPSGTISGRFPWDT